MSVLHLGYGNKGGVGKSFFVKLLLEYFIYKEWIYRLFDLDAGNHDVGKIYAPKIYNPAKKDKDKTNEEVFLQFTDNKNNRDEVDTLFVSAMNIDTIINLPSNVKHLLEPWIINNGLIELAKENDVRFIQWFVCSGSQPSIDEFYLTLDKFKNSNNFTHVFVKNYGMEENWSKILTQNKKLKETLEADRIITFDLPELSSLRYSKMLDNNLTFSAAKNSDKLNVIDKQAVKKFLDTAYENFNAVFTELGISGVATTAKK